MSGDMEGDYSFCICFYLECMVRSVILVLILYLNSISIMRAKERLGIMLLFLYAFCFISCDKDDDSVENIGIYHFIFSGSFRTEL